MRRSGAGLGVLAAAAAAAVLWLAPARAADMAPPSYYPPAPLPPAVYDWTGVYVGGNVGAGLLSDLVSQNVITANTTNLNNTMRVAPLGVIGGAQVGFNYDFHPLVVGAEASWTDSDITGSGLGGASGTVNGTPVNQERNNSAPLWFATATGRIGYAPNTVLLYLKGGGAWMDVEYTQSQLASGVTAGAQTIHDHRLGFTAGVGLEYGMTENLSARFEYDFFDFGTRNYPFNQTPVAIRSDLNALVVGLNYRFTWAGGWH